MTPPARRRANPDARRNASNGHRDRYADADAVEAVAAQWTDEQITCRDLGHHWRPADALHVARLRYWRVSHECARCGMVRIREMSESGHVFASSYVYPEGYLVKGLGRIAGEAKDAVRIAAVRRVEAVEVSGNLREVRKTHPPRFGATRRAVES